jgi:peptidoglycan/LPS O-acetylase OafA/YrhL
VKNNSPKEILFLDGLRGLAALYVLIHHARWLLWEGYNEGFLIHPQQYSIFNKLLVYFFSFFRFGYEAVLLFFILSGFVIHLRYAIRIKENGSAVPFDYWAFIKKRILRIYPPFIFVLLLTFFLDTLGMYLNYSIYNSNTSNLFINQHVHADHSMLTLLGNLIFTLKIYVPAWGTNEALWSLALEWWFYMLYPLFFYIHRKNILASTLIIAILFCLSFIPFPGYLLLPERVFYYMIIWWLGVLLADIYTKRINLDFKWISPLFLLLILLLLNLIPEYFIAYKALLWGLGFTGLFAFLFHLKENNIIIAFLNKLKPLGSFSYSLYVIHFPVLVLFSGFITNKNGRLPNHFGYVFLGIMLGLIFGYVSYLIAEKPFLRTRHQIPSPIANPKTI